MTRAYHIVSKSKKRLTFFGALVVLAVSATAAIAYFTSTGAGTGTASVGSLNAPQNPSASASGASVTVEWDAALLSNATPAQSYTVERYTDGGSDIGPACGGATIPSSAGIPNASGHFTCTDTPGLGTFKYKITAKYNTWTATSNFTNTVTIADTTPPTSSITFPANGAFYNTSGYNAGCSTPSTGDLCGTANDPGAPSTGINKVQVAIQRSSDNKYWNGSGWVSLLMWNDATGTTSWNYALDAADLTDGVSYTVESQAIDNASNTQTTPDSKTFTYDTSAPTATITFPASGGFFNAVGWDATGAITGTAVDGGSGVASVKVAIQDGSGNYYDGSGFNNGSITYLTATGTTSWSYAIASSKLTNGHTYNITVQTTDNTTTANTNNSAATRSFTWDTAAPTATITFPASGGFYNAAGWDATGAITGTAADTGSGVATVKLSIQKDGGANSCWDGTNAAGHFTSACPNFVSVSGTTSWSKTLTSGALVNGSTYAITVQTADNTITPNTDNSAATRSFTYDTSAPTATITFPTATAYNASSWTGTLIGTASDGSGSGVSSVKVSIQKDGGANACWDGTDAAGHFGAACPNYVSVSGTTNWTKPLSVGSLVNGSSYVMTAQTTDNTTTPNTNNSAATAAWTYDTTAPTLSTLQMFDTNGNGKVDQVKATFNETLNTSYSAPNTVWTLANAPGGAGNSISSVSVSGAVATLTLNEGNVNTAPGTYSGTTLSQFTIALAANPNGIRDAAGNQSSFAATAVVDKAAPIATSLTFTNNGAVNTPDRGDSIAVAFSEPLAVASMCSTWSGNTSNQTSISGNSAPVTFRFVNNAVPVTSFDQFIVQSITGGNCSSFSFGTVDLGSQGYVAANQDSSGNGSNASMILWTFSSRTVLFTLGTVSGTSAVATNPTATYTPGAAITDIGGNLATGTISNTGNHF